MPSSPLTTITSALGLPARIPIPSILTLTSLPPLLPPVLCLSHALVLALDSPPLLKYLIASTDVYLMFSLSQLRIENGPFIQTWMQGMTLFGTILICFNLIVFRARKGEFVRIDGDGREVGGYVFDKRKRGFRERIRDAIGVVCASRGVGWKWQIRNLPRPPPETMSASRFVLGNAWGLIWRMFMIEANRIYFLRTSVARGQNLHYGPWWYRLLVGTMCIFQAQITVELPHLAVSMLCVMVGWNEPSDWPPMFDSVFNAWSVRRFWSRYWHQILRGMAEPPVGYVLHDLLKAPHRSYLSNYGKVFGNFYAAYLMHAIPRVVAGGDVTPEWNFYMGQAVVIWLEVVISEAAFALGFPDRPQLNRLIGYVWTFVFQSWAWLHYNNAIHTITDLTVPIFGFYFVEPLLKLVGWD